MEKEIAVANTNSLLYIVKLGIFQLVKKMFKEIRVTSNVLEEIFQKESIENIEIEKELKEFLKEVKVERIKELPLGEGEKSGISYCLENNIKTFLSDDKKARIAAESLGLKAKGVLGILLWNFENRNISKGELKTLIDQLIEKGYYMSIELYTEIMKAVD